MADSTHVSAADAMDEIERLLELTNLTPHTQRYALQCLAVVVYDLVGRIHALEEGE